MSSNIAVHKPRKRAPVIMSLLDSVKVTQNGILADHIEKPPLSVNVEGQGEMQTPPDVSIQAGTEPIPAPVKPIPSKPLTLKQRQFVNNYAKPSSPTFGNQVRSAIKAHIGGTYGSSAAAATELLKQPKIESEVTRAFEAHNLTVEDRTGALSSLLHKERNVTEQRNASGDIVSSIHSDNDKIRLAVVRELNRMDGTYARAESVARAQRDAIQPLVAHYAHQLREALKAEEASPREPIVVGQGADEALDQPITWIESSDAVAGLGEGMEGNVAEGTGGSAKRGGEGVPPVGVSL